MLTTRQENLLTAIIKDYTRTAKPISSSRLVDHESLRVSPATLRHDMAELEEAGYLSQPHTSAGRIPTELAWRWYVKRVDPELTVSKRDQQQLEAVTNSTYGNEQEMLRHLAKALTELINGAVIIAFDKTDTYYTGLSNLFQQPEFEDINVMQNLSRVVDHLDDVMAQMYERVGDEARVLVGRENPFSASCGTILGRYVVARRHNGVIGFLGPLRQEYGQHLALLRYTQHLLQTV